MDEKLQKLFNGETYISGFTMNKYIGAHLVAPAVPDNDNNDSAQQVQQVA